MNDSSEAILALKPVTFHYKTDTANRREFGLIAEEVAEVRSWAGRARHERRNLHRSLRPVNAMLVNEFIKEHKAFITEQRTVEEQGRRIQEQEAR